MEISDVIKKLRELNEPESKHFRLPRKNEVAEAENRLGVKFSEDYKRFLLEASDVVYGALEPAVVVPNSGYLYLIEVANSAWNEMEVPRDLLPICEDNGDYYCLNGEGEVVFWSHEGVADEKWNSLAEWLKEVWIEGN
jgi:SMI1-KNR4 cell-wall